MRSFMLLFWAPKDLLAKPRSSLAEATELAKGCPVLQSGGTVEVRPIMHID